MIGVPPIRELIVLTESTSAIDFDAAKPLIILLARVGLRQRDLSDVSELPVNGIATPAFDPHFCDPHL